jgi:hypothetical protein
MDQFLTVRFLVLVVAYSALTWFVNHQGSHLVMVREGKVALNPALAIVLTITSSPLVYIGLLVWIGYRINWYFPIALFILSFVVRPLVFVSTEVGLGWDKKAWAISLIGIIAIPLIVIAMVCVVEML